MDSEKKRIYPMGCRQNYNPILYSDIAVRNYIRAKEQFDVLDFSANGCEEDLSYDLFGEYVISTIIFSTMCIEAFLNDYAAACLGDKEYYGYFDKLSIDGKFALIAKFVFSASIDKSQAYYYRLKRLIRERNEYTHSKSTFLESPKLADLNFEIIDDMVEKILAVEINPAPYREMLDSAKNALLAIRDIALFFDTYDASVDAIARLFCCGSSVPDNNGVDIRDKVLKELCIKNMVVTS